MSRHNMTEAEREKRRQLTNERQNAVRYAWKEEQDRVKEGKGTRDWSVDEQKELLKDGRVKGYEGHHMKSVSEYPEEAGNPKNIQFLTEDEHLNGAHQGSYHKATNGYYDPNTGTMNEFVEGELESPKETTLTESYSFSEESNQESINFLGLSETEIKESSEVIEAENYMGPAEISADSTNEYGDQSVDNPNEID